MTDDLVKQPQKPRFPQTLRGALTVTCVLAFLALSGAAGCIEKEDPRPSVESRRGESQTLRGLAKLRIGVRMTLPFLSYRPPNSDELSGFEVDIARGLAHDLGFGDDKIEWVEVADLQSRFLALQNSRADIVVASMTMRSDRPVDFAGPYLVMPQAVMVSSKSTKPTNTIEDLKALSGGVCVGIGTTTEAALRDKGITPKPVNQGGDCVEGLKSGRYDAYSSDLQVLASVAAQNPGEFKILDLIVSNAPEEIGVALPKGDKALRDLIAYFLNRWSRHPETSPWLAAYNNSIGPHLNGRYASQPRVKDVPDLADYDSKAPRP